MNVHHYETSGGKDLILEYIDRLPKAVKRVKELEKELGKRFV